jgi:hypothetical protein
MRRQPYRAGVALFLNSTLTSYHWGCYGTSAAIHQRLVEAGYLVHSFPVEVTHAALPGVDIAVPIDFEAYDAALKGLNVPLYVAINDADVVVVNGEGTIHRGHAGPINLLALIAYLRVLGKPVHLINHSCFPNGDASPAEPALEAYYRDCLSGLDTVAVREPLSVEVYARLGVQATLAFDCLPLYIATYLERPKEPVGDTLLVSVINTASDQDAARVGAAVEAARGQHPVAFLAGGYKRRPTEDVRHYQALASEVTGLSALEPATIEQWVAAIASARLLVTGRYHHFIAALAVGTPVVLMPGIRPRAPRSRSGSAMRSRGRRRAWPTASRERYAAPPNGRPAAGRSWRRWRRTISGSWPALRSRLERG